MLIIIIRVNYADPVSISSVILKISVFLHSIILDINMTSLATAKISPREVVKFDHV